MAEPVNALTLQFLEWIASGRRTHADVMETWRSSCPRLSIWEDAVLDGLVRYDSVHRTIELTSTGRVALAQGSAMELRTRQAAD
jgi:hypothetical protein